MPPRPRAIMWRNRWFVSDAVAKPAYCRIVQRRPRYIDAWMPRVNGYSPGAPRLSAGVYAPFPRSPPPATGPGSDISLTPDGPRVTRPAGKRAPRWGARVPCLPDPIALEDFHVVAQTPERIRG